MSNKNIKTKNQNIEENLLEFEKYYNKLESSFIDVIKIIPLENDSKTFSPRLYELLQSICSQIEGVMKLMCGGLDGIKYIKFPIAYKELNRDEVINKQEISLISHPQWKKIIPFQCDFACHHRENDINHVCVCKQGTPK